MSNNAVGHGQGLILQAVVFVVAAIENSLIDRRLACAQALAINEGKYVCQSSHAVLFKDTQTSFIKIWDMNFKSSQPPTMIVMKPSANCVTYSAGFP